MSAKGVEVDKPCIHDICHAFRPVVWKTIWRSDAQEYRTKIESGLMWPILLGVRLCGATENNEVMDAAISAVRKAPTRFSRVNRHDRRW